ncbi:MAG TPA: FAD binding domain-containing protein [Gaiellaceae bacterium]|nr:FAD binding domain-containing protein [Gaiellaceae bacterium]
MSVALQPRSLEEALELRSAHPEAVPVAGGTDLMVEVNLHGLRPPALLDLSRVEELNGWSCRDGVLRLGAGTTFDRIGRELATFSPLAQAAHAFASPQVRKRATIGGNVVTASPAADGLAVLAAYDADVVVAAAGRPERRVPWSEFVTGPKQIALAPDELVAAVEWRPVDGPGSFSKLGVRNAMVIAVASVCVQLDTARHRVRLALGSVGPTVLRAPRAEALASSLDWKRADGSLAEVGRLAAAETAPIDDVRGSARYRRHAVEVLASRALGWALADRKAAPC